MTHALLRRRALLDASGRSIAGWAWPTADDHAVLLELHH